MHADIYVTYMCMAEALISCRHARFSMSPAFLFLNQEKTADSLRPEIWLTGIVLSNSERMSSEYEFRPPAAGPKNLAPALIQFQFTRDDYFLRHPCYCERHIISTSIPHVYP